MKGESETSDGYQAGNVNNEALHVIGLHGSGDKIPLCLQDWEMAKVASSCRMALDILCQEMYEVERRRGWFSLHFSQRRLTCGAGSRPFLTPWCAEGEVPTGVNLNRNAGNGSRCPWHCDNERLFGRPREPKVVMSVSLGHSVLFCWSWMV